MSIRLEPQILAPVVGRSRLVLSGSASLLNPVVCVVTPIPLSLNPCSIVVSPLYCSFTPGTLSLTPSSPSIAEASSFASVALDLTPITGKLYGILARTSHVTGYSTLLQVVHRTSYQYPALIAIHATTYGVMAENQIAFSYRAYELDQSTRVVSYRSLDRITSSLETSYRTLISESDTRSLSYRSLDNSVTVYSISYRSLNNVLSTKVSAYQALETFYSTRSSDWRTIEDCQTLRSCRYLSVTSCFGIIEIGYSTEDTSFVSTTRTCFYTSSADTALVLLGDPVLMIGALSVPIVSASITADEDSSYYQCEVELQNARDYLVLTRDTEFSLTLFSQTYAFVVDSRTLSRSIDDGGNLQETATVTGLSPACRFAAPRASSLTKTWETAQLASEICTELLGSIAWNLVDWVIPAYRLSADQSYPLDIAKQIVEAAGGLLESNPDGSLVARSKWPCSIARLDGVAPAATWTERQIYAVSEQATQDQLMDRIRIVDVELTEQDKLEFVVDENDPWSGIVYVYPSPWRDALSLVTTRGSKVQIGPLSEGVKTIADEEIISFENGSASTNYPIQTLVSVEWLDDSLGSLLFAPYSSEMTVTNRGSYGGYSLGKVTYTTRYWSAPVYCQPDTESILAQFLLLEDTSNG